MAKTTAEWRVTYVRNIGERVRGRNSWDAFKFFEDDEKGLLGLEYCAFLECKSPIDERWSVLGRVIKPGTLFDYYILQDLYGEQLSRGNLTSRVFTIFLKTQHPSVHDFLWSIDSPHANEY